MNDYIGFLWIFLAVASLALLEFCTGPYRRANLINLYGVIFLIAIVGLRGEFDSDYEAYVGIYEQVSFDTWSGFKASFSLNVEILFVLIMVVLKIFWFSAQSLFLVSAAGSLLVTWVYCLRRVAYPTLVLLGLLSHALLYKEFTEIRHGIAGALCLASLFLVSSNQPRRALWLQILAAFFHSASLFVMLFSYLFQRLGRRHFIYCTTGIGLLVFAVGIQNILNAIGAVVPLPGSVTVYSNSEYDFNLGLLNPTLIKQALSFSFFLLCVRAMQIRDKLYLDLLCFYYVSIAWLFGANEFAMFAGRLASFFGVIEVYLFSMTMAYIKSPVRRFLYFAILVVLYFAQFYLNVEFKGLFERDYHFA